ISGGGTQERLHAIATTGAEYVSVGALTHSAPAADLSFELEPDRCTLSDGSSRPQHSAPHMAADPLPLEIDAALRATASARGIFGTRVFYFAETGSTNDVAALAAERGEPDGTLVIAAAQTAGRGRLGRTWYSPPGAGLYVSAVLRDAAIAPWLTLAGGVGVAEGLRAATGLPMQLKWPN